MVFMESRHFQWHLTDLTALLLYILSKATRTCPDPSLPFECPLLPAPTCAFAPAANFRFPPISPVLLKKPLDCGRKGSGSRR